MSRRIQVRPLNIERWHGKTGSESFAGSFTITPLVDAATRTYKTMLSPEEIEKFSKEIGEDLTPKLSNDKPHTFWDSEAVAVRLENRTNFIDVDQTLGYIQSRFLLGSKYVANSMKEWEEGLWPEAQFVIIDEETDSDIKASKLQITKSAIIESAKLPKDRKVAIILILSGKIVGNKSDNFIEVALDEEIQKNPQEVLNYIKMDKKEILTHGLILEALQRYVITKVGHRYMYHDSVIGEDIYEAIKYLNTPENQELKLRIQAAIAV